MVLPPFSVVGEQDPVTPIGATGVGLWVEVEQPPENRVGRFSRGCKLCERDGDLAVDGDDHVACTRLTSHCGASAREWGRAAQCGHEECTGPHTLWVGWASE